MPPTSLDDLSLALATSSPATLAAVVQELRARKVLRRLVGREIVDWEPSPADPRLTAHTNETLLRIARLSITAPNNHVRPDLAPASVPRGVFTAVAAVMSTEKMETHADRSVSWPTAPFLPLLCTEEVFAGQPHVPAVKGTAFAIDRTRVVTAGHVLSKTNLDQLRLAFGAWTYDAATRRVHFPASRVRLPSEVLHHAHKPAWQVGDYCVATLASPLPRGAYIPRLRREPVAKDVPLYVLGYPLGRSLTYADDAKVTRVDPPYWFGTTLDLVSGTSGGPVFDAVHNEIVGIASHGEGDLMPGHPDCERLKITTLCNEQCTPIELLLPLL